MHHAGSFRRLTLGAVLAALAVADVPTAANAASTCSYTANRDRRAPARHVRQRPGRRRQHHRAPIGAQHTSSIIVSGGGGSDFISGRGGHPSSFPPAATVKLVLDGDAGDDTLVDGLAPSTGGPFASFAADVEQFTIASVGSLRLDPAAVHAQAGGVACVGMSWTHPKTWRQLRSLELRVMRGSEPVGRAVVRPATDEVRAHGKLALAAGSRVDHHGKTVTAELAVRLPKSLAGERLRIDVQATDQRGRAQLEPAAGTIAVR